MAVCRRAPLSRDHLAESTSTATKQVAMERGTFLLMCPPPANKRDEGGDPVLALLAQVCGLISPSNLPPERRMQLLPLLHRVPYGSNEPHQGRG